MVPVLSLRIALLEVVSPSRPEPLVSKPGYKVMPPSTWRADAVDIVGVVGGQPNGGTADIVGLADPLVGHQLHQFGIRLGRAPCVHIDRCPNGTRRDGVDADTPSRHLQGNRLHHQHHAVLRRRIIDVSGPGMTSWTELMQMILPAAQETALTTPRRLHSRTASRAQRNWPVRFTAMTLFHCASVISSKGASFCRPALSDRQPFLAGWKTVRHKIGECSGSLIGSRPPCRMAPSRSVSRFLTAAPHAVRE